MFPQGQYQYQLDLHRQNRLLQEAEREQFVRRVLRTSPSPRRYVLTLVQFIQSLLR